MSSYLFFLIPLLFAPALAWAETGFNYDLIPLGITPEGDTIYQWTSHYPRILDSDWQYKNYLLSDDKDYLRFESASLSFEFYKKTCDLKVYDGGYIRTDPPIINSLSHTLKEAANGTDTWTSMPSDGCGHRYTTNNDGIQIITTKVISEVEHKVIYDIEGSFGVEWTHEITNNNSTKTDQKFGVTDVFDTAVNVRIDDIEYSGGTFNKTDVEEKRIEFDSVVFETKNDQHDFLWEIKKEKGQTIVDFTHSKGRLDVGDTLVIDPVFSDDSPYDGFLSDDTAGDTCNASPTTITKTTVNGGNDNDFGVTQTGITSNCRRAFTEFDISSIPGGATITDSHFKFEVDVTLGSTRVGDIMAVITHRPSTATDANLWTDLGDGAAYVDNTSDFNSVGANKDLDLGASADADIQAAILADQPWFALGFKHDNECCLTGSNERSFMVSQEDGGGNPTPTLEITYTAPGPDAVDDLTSPEHSFTTVDLSWTEPGLNNGTLQGYQVNQTTPPGDPQTTVVNDTGSSSTTYEVTGLAVGTSYSFRVSAWTENGNNATGNILNVTTLGVGNFTVDYTNPDTLDIAFDEIPVNSNTRRLNVTFTNTLNDLRCNFDFQFAQVNHTYTDLESIVEDATHNETSFLLANVTNEIVDVYCWNGTSANGSWIITQTDIPLITQIQDFQGGSYGTQGEFGAIDIVALIGVVLAMIGFNRVNESVGGIVGLMMVLALGYFQIITLPSIIFGALAVVTMLVIASTRKR